jgi:hypothetical protein
MRDENADCFGLMSEMTDFLVWARKEEGERYFL